MVYIIIILVVAVAVFFFIYMNVEGNADSIFDAMRDILKGIPPDLG